MALDAAALKALSMSRRAVQGLEDAAEATVGAAKAVARNRAEVEVMSHNRSRLDSARARASAPVHDPVSRLHGQLAADRIEQQAREAGVRAVKEVDRIRPPEPTAWQVGRAGGEKEAMVAGRSTSLGREFAGHPAVTAPAGEAQHHADAYRRLWWGSAVVDGTDKLADDAGQKLGAPVYHNFKERFTLEIGSSW